MSNPVIYATADLHGNLPTPPKDADVLLIAGDICPDYLSRRYQGDKGEAEQSNWLNYKFRMWLNALYKRGVQVVGIWGNHDFVGEMPWLIPDLPWTLLQDSETKIQGGLRVWGTPWVPNLPFWAFHADENRPHASDLIPEGIDILMSHGPPFGACDQVVSGYSVGSSRLGISIMEKRPRLTVCGHIHEARGVGYLNDNEILNVSAVDERYKLSKQPFTRLFP